MLLNEITDLKVNMLVSSTNKLVSTGIKVHLITKAGDGTKMFGEVVKIALEPLPGVFFVHPRARPKQPKKHEYYLHYYEIYHGKMDSEVSSTSGPMIELQHATLKKNEDGSYTLNLPNAQVDRL